ncbi:phosphatidylinositol N-acetylglucosaminyltransferase subunit P [Plodia interpunctella]|uniref:phosphatidylinositol N-acetylglucosaminyltransferase subunit P n=1 Tax=Plodia interpunctella TaxID=58824 RepID=UPI002367D6B5|nr:phosphatidylinositol N-acetylglucosaminyltransferase subunit P [Plodia interpunctella]XP_053626063.1 phosphatidylinositol N-acetylglucosaminyltransferase subunit P [Plodia interpunctella]XP_053626064.1 phosphatidylinositol N-acetylglucosaminyltransferase subunit P [Plodia interpunctella]XP_053626065.1 phosphatidylinositol N-acetylglucosaminyltransferase subunit P [Plodia interpunctella]
MPEHTPAPTPARSLYGFFMYVFSKTLMGIYLIWAIVPDCYLHYLSIYYYPLKYWSTAVPIQCLVALTLFAFLIYPSFNLILTTNIDSINTIQDPFSQYVSEVNTNTVYVKTMCCCIEGSKCKKRCLVSPKEFKDNTVPPLHDLNISMVCRKMYLNKQTLK